MAISNHERVRKSLELLNKGLLPFIEREMKAVHGEKWLQVAQQSLGDIRHQQYQKDGPKWDTQAILSVMWDNWNTVFNKVLSQSERTLVSELKSIRNKWAHQEAFSTDDTYRAIDSCGRLLISISAAEEAAEMERQKQEILRIRFDEQRKKEEQRASVAPIEGRPMSGLKPWREVMTPHPDVASGRYQQAEFAADLSQVHRGEGSDEYRDPREFFSRTFFTEGLRQLLTTALRRLSDQGGDPVVELHTNFGGGKTHSMLALYHMFSGIDFTDLPGVDTVLTAAGGLKPSKASRAVLVGTALSPGHSTKKPDGTVVNTMWGELAWQLLGSAGYKLVEDTDKSGVSPGSDRLRELFTKAAPSITLIDEWVVYVRQLYNKEGLPGGSFDSNLSFAQSLTEAARAVPKTLVVASIPSSDIEIGGEAGKEVLSRLRNIFSRMESAWRPASAEESFEIVRRRLFQPLTDASLFAGRDAVCRAFADYYRNQKAEFPSACSEGGYERRLQAAYPIHPELFDRLFNDWSTLEKFQRTRGVLRLMAAVISILWERTDSGLLIMPASIPMDASAVQTELTRYLEDSWVPVIEKDIDGPNSLPLELDKQNPNYGKYSACRRVARTLFLGSAATLKTAQKGLDDKRIKLGCFQPGETPATFGDALGRLADTATHLYVDGSRYWYSTQPSVMRVAEDRAVTQDPFDIYEEIKQRLRGETKQRGDFVGIHVAPSSADVPDEPGIKLVIFGPEQSHGKGDEQSLARKLAEEYLAQRGSSPRFHPNTLVFLAADRNRLDELQAAVRKYLAWKSVEKDIKELNLDVFQTNQVQSKVKSFDETVNLRIQETYTWLLVPGQSKPAPDTVQPPITWDEIRMQAGADSLSGRCWRKLKDQELVVKEYAGSLLRRELDGVPLWRGEHVSIKQLAEDYSKYLYLQRLRDNQTLLGAIKDGLSSTAWEMETFAYADGFDETTNRYLGLRVFDSVEPSVSSNALVVKPSAARKQIDADRSAQAASGQTSRSAGHTMPVQNGESTMGSASSSKLAVSERTKQEEADVKPRRYYGSVTIDATRLSREIGKISDEVISHLAGLVGAKVEVTIEVQAEIVNGVPENVVRTVLENAKTLKFSSSDFEND